MLDLLSNALSDRYGLYALVLGLAGNLLLLAAGRFLIKAERLLREAGSLACVNSDGTLLPQCSRPRQ